MGIDFYPLPNNLKIKILSRMSKSKYQISNQVSILKYQ